MACQVIIVLHKFLLIPFLSVNEIMARTTSLNKTSINQICKCLKLRMRWKEIAAGLGVEPRTIREWLKRGKTDQQAYEKGKRSVFHKLYEAVEETKANLIEEYAGVVRNALTQGTTTKTTKTPH